MKSFTRLHYFCTINFPKSVEDSKSVPRKTVIVGLQYRWSDIPRWQYIHTHVCWAVIQKRNRVAKVSSPIESAGLTRLCRDTHPKFYSPTQAGKENAFVPNRHHQIVIIKPALDTSFKPPHYDSNHSSLPLAILRILHQPHSAAVDQHAHTFSASLSPRWKDQQYRRTSFLLNCSLEADGWNPKAAPAALHKESSRVKIRQLLNMQKAIMLKTRGEPCKVQIKSQRHRRQEKDLSNSPHFSQLKDQKWSVLAHKFYFQQIQA